MAERAKGKTKTKAKKAPKGATGSRGRVAKTDKPGIGHNSAQPSAALVKDHHEKISAIEIRLDAAKAKYDQIKGEHRAAFAVVKQDQIDVEAFKLARELDKRDHGEVIVGYANVGGYLAAIQSPLALQLELFQELSKNPPHNPTLAGTAAFQNGEDRGNNPYRAGSEEYAEFDAAWLAAADKVQLSEAEGATQH